MIADVAPQLGTSILSAGVLSLLCLWVLLVVSAVVTVRPAVPEPAVARGAVR